jgi:hypothetical protein
MWGQRGSTLPTVARQRQKAIAGWLSLLSICLIALFAAVASGVLGPKDATSDPGFENAAESVASTAVPDTSAAGAGQEMSGEPVDAPSSRELELSSKEIEIGWVGDLTLGSSYGMPPEDGRALFAPTREYTTRPDVMIANLEGTLGSGGASKCDGKDSSECYAFQAPPKNAAALAWAGFDVVNLANNHSLDYFQAGLQTTRDALDENAVDYTGLNDTVALRNVDGVTVAVLGFSPYPWSPDIGDLEAARQLVRQAGEDADVVVVLMHAGAEGVDKMHTPEGPETAYGEFRGDSRAFAHAVIDAGADVVLGSGPHVVRGIEEYEGRLIAYSLGNFAGWKNFNRKGDRALSGLLTVRVAGDGAVLGGTWLSLRIAEPGVPQADPSGESARLVRRLSQEDFDTPVALHEDGTFQLAEE